MHTAAVAREIPFFPYPQVFLSEEDQLVQIFRDVGRRGAFILQEDLRHFEENLARYLGAHRAIGVGNATDALWIALRAAGIERGDEIIFCSHTMVATASAIHFAGGVPVPVDCSADHLIDPGAVEAAITPRTKAILPTQLNGRTADMDALGEIAARHGLILIEDAAQALGSRFKGKMAGTFGAAAAISFFPAKLLGCLGDGGAVIANNRETAARVEALHDHGRGADGEVTGWGVNSRLDNLQAAILDFRLAKYGAVIEHRRMLAAAYRERLSDLSEIVLPPGPSPGIAGRTLNDVSATHFDVYQNYEIEAEHRDPLREHLRVRGIGTLVPWGGKAVHQWPALGLAHYRLPVAERLFERVMLLPMHAWLTVDQVDDICSAIRSFYRS